MHSEQYAHLPPGNVSVGRYPIECCTVVVTVSASLDLSLNGDVLNIPCLGEVLDLSQRHSLRVPIAA